MSDTITGTLRNTLQEALTAQTETQPTKVLPAQKMARSIPPNV